MRKKCGNWGTDWETTEMTKSGNYESGPECPTSCLGMWHLGRVFVITGSAALTI